MFCLLLSLNYGLVCGRTMGAKASDVSGTDNLNVIVDINTIANLVFEYNPEILAARYAREAAEYQFKDFERNLSQFTPFISNSSITRQDRSPDEDHDYSTEYGVQKDFFDGGSVFGGVGHSGGFGDSGGAGKNFIRTDITLPLFSSNTTLRRITDRSRQENELFNTRLQYIAGVRGQIWRAQMEYLNTVLYKERGIHRGGCISDFESFLTTERVKANSAYAQQIQSEIQELQADVMHYQERVDVRLLDLALAIGLDSLGLERINGSRMFARDVFAGDFYGKSYLTKSVDELLAIARQNDIRVRVLENARANSVEKKRLALEGKWDAFLDLDGRLDVAGSGDAKDDNGYSIESGLRVDRVDPVLLDYSLKRAEAEIKEYDAYIKEQLLNTRTVIERGLFDAKTYRSRHDQILGSIHSKYIVYNQKLEDFTEGKETLDKLIGSRKEIVWEERGRLFMLLNYYKSIAILDRECGVYLAKLGINTELAEGRQTD